ncbi:MAG: MFS transporter [Solirubrobacteraceae bacterium]|nr:MFS transporter [Patulibacter sp.]
MEPHVVAPDAAASAEPVPGIVEILRRPHVLSTLGLALVARLPLGASALLLLLRLTGAGANYAEAGAVAGCFGAAIGVGQPLWSRLIDRRGQPSVLIVSGTAAGVMFVAIALLPAGASLGAWFAVAAVAGVCQPPIGSAMRSLWSVLLDRDEERHVGFAIDASAFEIVFTVGPVLFVGFIATVASSSAAFGVGALLLVLGSVGIARSAPSRAWQPEPHDDSRSFFAALRSPGTITILLVYVGLGGCFGSIEVALAAFARANDAPSMASVLLALWSAGSVAGGLVLARAGASGDPARRLVVLALLLAASNGVLGLLHDPVVLGAVLVVAGAWVAPIFGTASTLTAAVATPGTLTESVGWTVTATTVGMTSAAPAAGAVIDATSPGVALSAAALPVLVAGLVTWLRRDTLAGDGEASTSPQAWAPTRSAPSVDQARTEGHGP